MVSREIFSRQTPQRYPFPEKWEHTFEYVVRGFSKDTFALLHLNIRSINKHFEELQLLLDNHTDKPTLPVIGLTETWLSSDSTLPFTLNGYDFIVNKKTK